MKGLQIKKLYYSISEVSEMTSLKPYVLRYWESEFPQLRPSKNRAGNRIYRSNDIKVILTIKRLLYTEKYTIEGARQQLQKELSRLKHKKSPQLDLNLGESDGKDSRQKQLVEELRTALKEILELLET